MGHGGVFDWHDHGELASIEDVGKAGLNKSVGEGLGSGSFVGDVSITADRGR